MKAKTKKINPAILITGSLLFLSMLAGYWLNEKTAKESNLRIARIEKSRDSSLKLLSDSLNFTISRYVQLQEQNQRFIKDTVRLYKENKHLNKTITKYVQIKNDADYSAIRQLSGSVTILENKQRERESGQR